jgi:hypothetical protein
MYFPTLSSLQYWLADTFVVEYLVCDTLASWLCWE